MTKKFKVNRAGIRELRKSDSVRDDMHRRAENVARDAGSAYRAVSGIGKQRARAAVIPTKDTPGKRGAKALEQALRRQH